MEETRKRIAEVWWFGAVLKFMQEDAIKQIGTAVVWAPILGRNRAILSMCKPGFFLWFTSLLEVSAAAQPLESL